MSANECWSGRRVVGSSQLLALWNSYRLCCSRLRTRSDSRWKTRPKSDRRPVPTSFRCSNKWSHSASFQTLCRNSTCYCRCLDLRWARRIGSSIGLCLQKVDFQFLLWGCSFAPGAWSVHFASHRNTLPSKDTKRHSYPNFWPQMNKKCPCLHNKDCRLLLARNSTRNGHKS